MDLKRHLESSSSTPLFKELNGFKLGDAVKRLYDAIANQWGEIREDQLLKQRLNQVLSRIAMKLDGRKMHEEVVLRVIDMLIETMDDVVACIVVHTVKIYGVSRMNDVCARAVSLVFGHVGRREASPIEVTESLFRAAEKIRARKRDSEVEVEMWSSGVWERVQVDNAAPWAEAPWIGDTFNEMRVVKVGEQKSVVRVGDGEYRFPNAFVRLSVFRVVTSMMIGAHFPLFFWRRFRSCGLR